MADEKWQATLRKKWNLKETSGTIIIKKYKGEITKIDPTVHRTYAYHVYHFMGKYIWRYLGKCDNLGRPLLKEKKL